MRASLGVLFVFFAAFRSVVAAANAPMATDADVVRQVGFNPTLGARVPANLSFTSHHGPLEIGSLLKERPSLITFAWFDCSNLCGMILNGLADSSGSPVNFDEDYQIIIVSMDAKTTQAQVRERQEDLAQQYPGAGLFDHWYFLTGAAGSIQALADALGYHFVYDQRKAEFAHPAGVIALDRQGRVRDFMTGVNYRAEDIARLIRSAQSSETVPARPNPVLLLCYDYDPSSGRYSLAIMKLLRLMAAACLLLFAGMFWYWQRKGKSHSKQWAENHE